MREDEPQPQQQPQHAEGGDLSRIDFQRMMDPSAEDIYRQCRDRLQQALGDPDTPRSALPAISKELTRVTDRLDRLEGGDPLLGGLEGSDTDDGSGTSEGSEQGATAAGRETV